MSQAFNFEFLECGWDRDRLREVIADSLAAMDAVGAPTTWVLSNHDVVRATSRFGMADPTGRPDGIRAEDPQPDGRLGLRRALAMHLLMAALPGSAYIWQGEELGLPEHTSLPDDVREDPAFFRTRGRETGRDGCRVPLPWVGDAPGFGFSPEGSSWLPQPADWRELAVDAQVADEASTLSFFRRMLALRRRLGLGHGGLADVAGVQSRVHQSHEGEDPVLGRGAASGFEAAQQHASAFLGPAGAHQEPAQLDPGRGRRGRQGIRQSLDGCIQVGIGKGIVEEVTFVTTGGKVDTSGEHGMEILLETLVIRTLC